MGLKVNSGMIVVCRLLITRKNARYTFAELVEMRRQLLRYARSIPTRPRSAPLSSHLSPRALQE
jgi:hypothetical protein